MLRTGAEKSILISYLRTSFQLSGQMNFIQYLESYSNGRPFGKDGDRPQVLAEWEGSGQNDKVNAFNEKIKADAMKLKHHLDNIIQFTFPLELENREETKAKLKLLEAKLIELTQSLKNDLMNERAAVGNREKQTHDNEELSPWKTTVDQIAKGYAFNLLSEVAEQVMHKLALINDAHERVRVREKLVAEQKFYRLVRNALSFGDDIYEAYCRELARDYTEEKSVFANKSLAVLNDYLQVDSQLIEEFPKHVTPHNVGEWFHDLQLPMEFKESSKAAELQKNLSTNLAAIKLCEYAFKIDDRKQRKLYIKNILKTAKEYGFKQQIKELLNDAYKKHKEEEKLKKAKTRMKRMEKKKELAEDIPDNKEEKLSDLKKKIEQIESAKLIMRVRSLENPSPLPAETIRKTPSSDFGLKDKRLIAEFKLGNQTHTLRDAMHSGETTFKIPKTKNTSVHQENKLDGSEKDQKPRSFLLGQSE